MANVRVARRSFLGLALMALASSGCMRDGRANLFGYTIGSLHDTKYRTIYVPIVENKAFQAGPLRGLECVLTESLQKEIERTTPYKVVSDREHADTELICTIVATPKHIINRNQLNEVREAQMDVQVEVVWRDVRTCEILSRPSQPSTPAPDVLPAAMQPTSPQPAAAQPMPKTVIVASGHFVPELGESATTALNRATKRLAVQIVSLMEKPW